MAYNDSEFNDKIAKIRALPVDDFWYDKECLQYYQLSSSPYAVQREEIVRQGNAMAETILIRLPDFFLSIAKSKFRSYPNAYNRSTWGDHDGCYSLTIPGKDKNKQREKNIAKALYNRACCGRDILLVHDRLTKNLGQVMDYEVPLNYEASRNIDLISKRSDKLYILELKKSKSKESLLRCLLEAYTYSKLVDRRRLKESFGMGDSSRIIVCPLIFNNSAAFQELHHIFGDSASEETSNILMLKRAIEREDPEIGIEFAVLDTDKAEKILQQIRDADGHLFNPTWLK